MVVSVQLYVDYKVSAFEPLTVLCVPIDSLGRDLACDPGDHQRASAFFSGGGAHWMCTLGCCGGRSGADAISRLILPAYFSSGVSNRGCKCQLYLEMSCGDRFRNAENAPDFKRGIRLHSRGIQALHCRYRADRLVSWSLLCEPKVTQLIRAGWSQYLHLMSKWQLASFE